jgi:hypothetical protein
MINSGPPARKFRFRCHPQKTGCWQSSQSHRHWFPLPQTTCTPHGISLAATQRFGKRLVLKLIVTTSLRLVVRKASRSQSPGAQYFFQCRAAVPGQSSWGGRPCAIEVGLCFGHVQLGFADDDPRRRSGASPCTKGQRSYRRGPGRFLHNFFACSPFYKPCPQ